MDGFTHLHVHSHYSLLDGGIRLPDLFESAKAFGMKAVALTDHGNLFGAMAFYKAARAAGVKPILGMEAYISPTTREDRSMGNIQTASYHMILLAMNETGWRNLVKLSSRAYLEGFYYRPRIDRQLLLELNEGLICTTACLGGEVPGALLAGQPDRARKIAGEYLEIFGSDRFFIEVQQQGLPEQDRVNPELAALAKDLGVGLVGTNDVHFLRRDDKSAHEVLTCISMAKVLDDQARMTYPPELYFKSPDEMRQLLAPWPSAADNTLRIAEMCNVELDSSAKHLPHFPTPDGQSPDEYLAVLARQGLNERFDGEAPEEYSQRLQRELEVIAGKGYSSYFLIINDCVQFARKNGIPAAPRGSAVATLLGYSLGISDVDPIHYGLLFERFTDPQREEDPDYDIDICQEGRGKVIQYVRDKYSHVAQIITYTTLKARAVLRDVGRVMDIPLSEVNAIVKLVPESLGMTLEKALAEEPELKRMYEETPHVRDMVEHGRRLEGLPRNTSVHAAGVIVAQEPLENLVPLCKQADSDDVITQWDGPTCDYDVGLMKMDLLGLRTLTILRRARELVRESTDKDIDPEKLSLDDDTVFELFRHGHTDGLFQFESDGMKNVLMQMQPTQIEDLIAANAMYRPGPMELIPSYCARKRSQEPVPSVHPLVDDILAETYGIMAYQEQVMQVLNRLGKLPLNRALTLIKAISKKKEKTIAAERPAFIEGAASRGISEAEADELFELILRFAGYGFNKAHSTRYAIVAYQTAFFKVHHSQEFLAATLTFESGDTAKVVRYMAEAGRMGVTIAPPDINSCGSDFAVDGPRVRFGLAAVKGVGEKAVEAVVAARTEVGRFKDLYHFCRHADLRAVNRATIEALVKCGAFDSLGASRAAMIAAMDQALEMGQQAAADRKAGQLSFLSMLTDQGAEEPHARFPDVEPWSEAQLLAAEKETLGFYVTSHPLIAHGRELASLTYPGGFTLAGAGEYGQDTAVTVGCMIAQVRTTVTRKDNRKMAMLTVEDLTGKCDAVVFPDSYEQFVELLVPEAIVFLCGHVDRRRERPNLIVDSIIPVDRAIEELTGGILLRMPESGVREQILQAIQPVLGAHSGACPVYMQLRPISCGDVLTTVRLGEPWTVGPTRELVDQLVELLGEQQLVLQPKKAAPRRRNGQRFSSRRSGQGRSTNAPASPAVTRFN